MRLRNVVTQRNRTIAYNYATVNVVRFKSRRRLEWPINTSNSPGSTIRLASESTMVHSETGISNPTVLVSPGLKLHALERFELAVRPTVGRHDIADIQLHYFGCPCARRCW